MILVSVHDLYWLPPAAVVAYAWLWLYRSRGSFRPIRLRPAVGLVALLLATGASSGLLATVIHSWVTGHFTWFTPFGGWGLLLGLLAVLVGVITTGRLRFLALISGLLSVMAWLAYLWDRRSPLWF